MGTFCFTGQCTWLWSPAEEMGSPQGQLRLPWSSVPPPRWRSLLLLTRGHLGKIQSLEDTQYHPLPPFTLGLQSVSSNWSVCHPIEATVAVFGYIRITFSVAWNILHTFWEVGEEGAGLPSVLLLDIFFATVFTFPGRETEPTPVSLNRIQCSIRLKFFSAILNRTPPYLNVIATSPFRSFPHEG